MRTQLIATLLLAASLPAWASMDSALADIKQGNYAAAVTELHKLGEGGDIRAQIMLGALYNKGGAVARDDEMAALWFTKAANQGNGEAQYQLGQLYENSHLSQNLRTAAKWYEQAAQQGYAKAQARLGRFYAEGMGVEKNLNEAILWSGKAALQGNADAQYWLGLGYMQGVRVPKNTALGIGWLTRAAAQGHADARLVMARAYQRGEGTPKDSLLAHALNSLAHSNPNAAPILDANQQRDELAKLLSSEQLAASGKLAAELAAPNNFTNALNAYIAKAHQAPFRFFDRPSKSAP